MTADNGPDISPKKKTFEVQPFLLYLNDVPVGIMAGMEAEQVIAAYRGMNLGKTLDTDVLRAVPTIEAPFEDFMRTAMNGIYLQMLESRMAAAQRRR